MDIKQRTEALLLAANRALTIKDIGELLEVESSEDESQVINAVTSLKEEYKTKPYDLVEVSSGYRIQLNQEYAQDVAKLWEVKPLRLSRATLETLSIISYMQPVTRGDIEDVRGVNVATNVIKILMDQGWIKIKGYRDVPGRPALFITTQKFLDDFSMKTLDDLPVLPDLPEIDNISPELKLQDDSVEQEAPAQ
jgi:segregation and condensation protein B